ncbi:MAG TPA: hypothetical protein P5322_03520 [Spirochaetota bacterium]|nr:hypothetical protein [Spirochaetota bacterium]HRU43574.1 hypothetical protein [Spirochaetota bacterium]
MENKIDTYASKKDAYVSIFRGQSQSVPYVSNFIGKRRGACSSICVIFSRGAAATL